MKGPHRAVLPLVEAAFASSGNPASQTVRLLNLAVNIFSTRIVPAIALAIAQHRSNARKGAAIATD